MTPPTRRLGFRAVLARAAGIVVSSIGALALLGWALDLARLRSVFAGLVEMKANTAACFAMAGLALALSGVRQARAISRGLATVVVAVAVVTLVEYASGWNIGLDELVFRDPFSLAMGRPPGRMAVATALAFALTGTSLALVAGRRHLVTAQALTFVAAFAPLFSLLAYLFGEVAITYTSDYTSLALNTAVAFAILGMGILLECSGAGPMAVLVASGPGGTSLRRLLPLCVVSTLGLGFAAFLGAREELYSYASGMILFAVATSVVLTGAIWANGWLLNLMEDARRLEADWLQMTLRSIGDAVIATDRQGRVKFLNPVAESLTGWSSGEVKGLPLEFVFRIINESTRAVVENPVARVLATGHIVGLANHTILIARDGTERPIDDSASPIMDGSRIAGVVLVFRDVTERKRAEEALKEADRKKDEFLATLAHELRNPLAPIRNGLQIMRMAGDDRRLIDESRSLMERQVTHMVRLIDDLMDVSRITRGKLELRSERIDLANVVRHAVETSRPGLEAAGHDLTLALPAGPVHLDADATRLSQVFSNLLNNATKYTPPGGRVCLKVEPQAGDVVVSVKDSGIGIPAEMLTRIFEMFTQVERSLERSQGGLGIGLTLVKTLVEMHGGAIEARSEGLGRGSEFVVRLPIFAPSTATTPTPTPRRRADDLPSLGPDSLSSTPARRILVVDDNVDSARTLARFLKLLGHQTNLAHDGGAAIELAEKHRPEIMLLDIGMPVMNGFEVARAIRANPWGRDVAIVALTGWGQEEDRRRSRESGIDHHLVKPVDPAVLEKLLADLQAARMPTEMPRSQAN